MAASDLVGEIEGVRRTTRRATRGGAVPLALLGLLVACAAPVYAAASRHDVHFVGGGGFFDPGLREPSWTDRLLLAHPNVTGSNAIGVYWLVAAPIAFAAVAAYYAWRARRTGLSIDGWSVAAFGGALFAVLLAVMANAGGSGRDGMQAIDVLNPFLVVALSVFALAWVERSVTVLLAALTFLGFLVLADGYSYSSLSNIGWERLASWGWATLVLGAVLLLWSGVVALVRRPRA